MGNNNADITIILQLTLCVASVAANAQGSGALLGCNPWVV